MEGHIVTYLAPPINSFISAPTSRIKRPGPSGAGMRRCTGVTGTFTSESRSKNQKIYWRCKASQNVILLRESTYLLLVCSKVKTSKKQSGNSGFSEKFCFRKKKKFWKFSFWNLNLKTIFLFFGKRNCSQDRIRRKQNLKYERKSCIFSKKNPPFPKFQRCQAEKRLPLNIPKNSYAFPNNSQFERDNVKPLK